MVNSATVSMTGFASARGEGAGHAWTWDLRAVNGKGLDLRLRLPETVPGLEQALRAAVGAKVARGSVTLSLRLSREAGGEGVRLSPAGLEAALGALAAATEAAARRGIELAPNSAAEVLGLRGVIETGAPEPDEEADTAPLLAALLTDFAPLLDAFDASRRAEGQALGRVIAEQIDRIGALTEAAVLAADARRPLVEAALKENLARVLAGAAEADPGRVAQELALLAVRADVAEELDRLAAHKAAAEVLLAAKEPTGRKFDFLIQEFMREANTLCSKSGSPELTRIGLDLKHVIDQMREQVQNVE